MKTSAPAEVFAAAARELIGAAEFTPPEVAQQAGVELALARQLWRALGFPPVPDDQRVFSATDATMLRGAAALMQQPSSDPALVLQLSRVMGQSLARIAEAQLAAVVAQQPPPVDEPEARPATIDLTAATTQTLLPSVEPFLAYVWRRHLVAAIQRLAAATDRSAEGAPALAVGFADLVGFTALSQQLEERELAELVTHFEELAYEHIPQGGGRVIKMIGDEVMFAADTAADAARIALDLSDVYTTDPLLPAARIGVAFGPTLGWQGDLFGPTVNLASRLVNIARPGTVLISAPAAEQIAGDPAFAVKQLRPVRLKGIGKIPIAVLRRPVPEPPQKQKRGSRRGLKKS